jgi:hypothetical protein
MGGQIALCTNRRCMMIKRPSSLGEEIGEQIIERVRSAGLGGVRPATLIDELVEEGYSEMDVRDTILDLRPMSASCGIRLTIDRRLVACTQP